MTPESLQISFGAEQIDSEILLKLEQEEWKNSVGVVTKSQFVLFLRNLLYGDGSSSPVDCGLTNGNLVTVIYAYPKYENLAYNINSSYGTLSSPVREEYEEEEIINISLSKTASTRQYVKSINSVEWISTKIYDSRGNITIAPTYTINSNELTFSKSVYGSLRIKYTVVRDVYILTIEPRVYSIQDIFGAVVYAIYNNGIVYKEITQPPGLDELVTEGYTCGWQSVGSMTSDINNDPLDSPKFHNAHRKTLIDYCTQLQISDDIYGY